MKLVTTKFMSEGLHEIMWWQLGMLEPTQHLLLGTEKPRKSCVEMAGRRTFRILTYSLHCGN